VLASASAARAEPFFDLYTGKSISRDSDVHVNQPSLGNDFTVHDVAFTDKSFSDPPWYGLRAGYFFDTQPWLGIGLEYFHFKMIGDTADSKPITGTRGGGPIATATRVDSIVQQFQITHGVNYLVIDGFLRYPLLKDPERFPQGRVHLYGGIGLGPVIAHAENRVEGVRNDEGYEVAGAGFQFFVGVRALVWKYVGLFAEYKFTHANLNVGVARGDADVDENTHHLVGGITVRLPPY
jgi:hypothetical protein